MSIVWRVSFLSQQIGRTSLISIDVCKIITYSVQSMTLIGWNILIPELTRHYGRFQIAQSLVFDVVLCVLFCHIFVNCCQLMSLNALFGQVKVMVVRLNVYILIQPILVINNGLYDTNIKVSLHLTSKIWNLCILLVNA